MGWNGQNVTPGRIMMFFVEPLEDLDYRATKKIIDVLKNHVPAEQIRCCDGVVREMFRCTVSDLDKLHGIACGGAFRFRTWVKKAYKGDGLDLLTLEEYKRIYAERDLKGGILTDGLGNPIGRKKLAERLARSARRRTHLVQD